MGQGVLESAGRKDPIQRFIITQRHTHAHTSCTFSFYVTFNEVASGFGVWGLFKSSETFSCLLFTQLFLRTRVPIRACCLQEPVSQRRMSFMRVEYSTLMVCTDFRETNWCLTKTPGPPSLVLHCSTLKRYHCYHCKAVVSYFDMVCTWKQTTEYIGGVTATQSSTSSHSDSVYYSPTSLTILMCEILFTDIKQAISRQNAATYRSLYYYYCKHKSHRCLLGSDSLSDREDGTTIHLLHIIRSCNTLVV